MHDALSPEASAVSAALVDFLAALMWSLCGGRREGVRKSLDLEQPGRRAMSTYEFVSLSCQLAVRA